MDSAQERRLQVRAKRWACRLAAGVLLAALWPASVALGCMCSLGQHVDAAEAIAVFVGVVEFQGFAAREDRRFVGDVLKVDCHGGDFVSLLRVEHAWKRTVPRWVVVDTGHGAGSCGYGLLQNQRYAFFVKGEGQTQIGCAPSTDSETHGWIWQFSYCGGNGVQEVVDVEPHRGSTWLGLAPPTIPLADLTAQLGPPLPVPYQTGVAAPPYFVDLAATIGTKWYHSPVRVHLELVHRLIVAVARAQRQAGYAEDANCLEPLANSTESLEDFVRFIRLPRNYPLCDSGYGKPPFLRRFLVAAAATLVGRYSRISGELVANYIMRVAELGGARVDWPDDEPARP